MFVSVSLKYKVEIYTLESISSRRLLSLAEFTTLVMTGKERLLELNLIVPALYKILKTITSSENKPSLPSHSGHCMIRRKKEERLGVRRSGFCSYMPPFFFDFFFLAFVGLFTRLHIHNGLCLRILRFFWKSILANHFFYSGPFQCPDLEIDGRIFFP